MQRAFKIVAFLILLSGSCMAQAFPFDSSTCSYKLTAYEDLDTIVGLTLYNNSNIEFRIQTLYLYIHQSNPNLHPTDVQHILNFIIDQNRFTDYEIEPSNIFQAFRAVMGYNLNPTPEALTKTNLSMESQILLWLLNHQLTDYTSISNALNVGNVHRFILRDIRRLHPNRSEAYYTSTLSFILTS
jgi:hypothetical protein